MSEAVEVRTNGRNFGIGKYVSRPYNKIQCRAITSRKMQTTPETPNNSSCSLQQSFRVTMCNRAVSFQTIAASRLSEIHGSQTFNLTERPLPLSTPSESPTMTLHCRQKISLIIQLPCHVRGHQPNETIPVFAATASDPSPSSTLKSCPCPPCTAVLASASRGRRRPR